MVQLSSQCTECWPAVTLEPYTGPCIFRESNGSSAVIDGKDVRAKCGELVAYHPFALTVRNSRVPRIEVTGSGQSLDIRDSEVVAWSDGALWGSNITATRVEVTGGQHSVHCEDDCTIVDSWLHGQYNPDGGRTTPTPSSRTAAAASCSGTTPCTATRS